MNCVHNSRTCENKANEILDEHDMSTEWKLFFGAKEGMLGLFRIQFFRNKVD